MLLIKNHGFYPEINVKDNIRAWAYIEIGGYITYIQGDDDLLEMLIESGFIYND